MRWIVSLAFTATLLALPGTAAAQPDQDPAFCCEWPTANGQSTCAPERNYQVCVGDRKGKAFEGYGCNAYGGGCNLLAWPSVETGCRGFAGTWHSDSGRMHINQNGDRVQGTYDKPPGTFEGTVNGRVLQGSYNTPGQGGGTMRLVLSTEGKIFGGNWFYPNGTPGGGWYGACATPGTAAAAPPPPPVTPIAASCGDLSGDWDQATPGVVNTRWTLARRADGTYTATETGAGFAKGTGVYDNGRLKIDWVTGDYRGYYAWSLDPGCASGRGELKFFAGGKGTHASTVVRSTAPPVVAATPASPPPPPAALPPPAPAAPPPPPPTAPATPAAVGAAAGEGALFNFVPPALTPAPLALPPVGTLRGKPQASLLPTVPAPVGVFEPIRKVAAWLVAGLRDTLIGIAHAVPLPTFPVAPPPGMEIMALRVAAVPKYQRGQDICPEFIDQEVSIEVDSRVRAWPYPFPNPGPQLGGASAWRNEGVDTNANYVPTLYLDVYVGGVLQRDYDKWQITETFYGTKTQAGIAYEAGRFGEGRGTEKLTFPLPDVLPANVRVELWATYAFFTPAGQWVNYSDVELVATKMAMVDVPTLPDASVKGYVLGDAGAGFITGYGGQVLGLPGSARGVNVSFELRGKPSTGFSLGLDPGQTEKKVDLKKDPRGPIKWRDPSSKQGRVRGSFSCPSQDRDMRNNEMLTGAPS